jgi:hypothetical protein
VTDDPCFKREECTIGHTARCLELRALWRQIKALPRIEQLRILSALIESLWLDGDVPWARPPKEAE